MSKNVTPEEFAKEVTKELMAMTRGIAIESQSRIIDKTPKDTGAAAASIKAAINSEDTSFNVTEVDYSGRKNQNESIIKGATQGDIINITMNAPYAERLEAGDSEQSPQGMFRTTGEELEAIMSFVAQKLSSYR